MTSIPDWAYVVMEWSVFVFYPFILWSAWRNGIPWFVTMLYGTLFGLAIEIAIVHGSSPSYTYSTRFIAISEAPLWVGLGWGIVLYACVRTANQLALSDSWRSDLLWRPLTAGYLAVSIDVTLDPVANAMHFWDWHCDCLLRGEPNCPTPCPADPVGAGHVLRFYGVPFDNFVGGWFAITAMYCLSLGLLSGAHRLFARKALPDARPLHHLFRMDHPDPTESGNTRLWEILFVWVAPALAMGIAGALFWFFLRPAAMSYYARNPTDGELRLCISVFVLAGLVTAYIAVFKDRTADVDWGIFAVPTFFNAVPVLLLVSAAFPREPGLYLDVPANLALGFLLFTWPFQEKLIAVGKRHVLAFQRWLGIVRPGADAAPAGD